MAQQNITDLTSLVTGNINDNNQKDVSVADVRVPILNIIDSYANLIDAYIPQAEAEAGLATTPRLWSAVRFAQALAALLPAQAAAIKAAYEGQTNTNAFTDAEKNKLGLVVANYKGYYVNLNALTTAHGAGVNGEWAVVGKTIAVWDSTGGVWQVIEGTGDMNTSVFDPQEIGADAFLLSNMVGTLDDIDETGAKKTVTQEEKDRLAFNLGTYADQTALETAHGSPTVGSFATVAATNSVWVFSGGQWNDTSAGETNPEEVSPAEVLAGNSTEQRTYTPQKITDQINANVLATDNVQAASFTGLTVDVDFAGGLVHAIDIENVIGEAAGPIVLSVQNFTNPFVDYKIHIYQGSVQRDVTLPEDIVLEGLSGNTLSLSNTEDTLTIIRLTSASGKLYGKATTYGVAASGVSGVDVIASLQWFWKATDRAAPYANDGGDPARATVLAARKGATVYEMTEGSGGFFDDNPLFLRVNTDASKYTADGSGGGDALPGPGAGQFTFAFLTKKEAYGKELLKFSGGHEFELTAAGMLVGSGGGTLTINGGNTLSTYYAWIVSRDGSNNVTVERGKTDGAGGLTWEAGENTIVWDKDIAPADLNGNANDEWKAAGGFNTKLAGDDLTALKTELATIFHQS